MQRLRALLGGGSSQTRAGLRRKDTGDEEAEAELTRLVPVATAAALRSRSRSPTPRGSLRGRSEVADPPILRLRVR